MKKNRGLFCSELEGVYILYKALRVGSSGLSTPVLYAPHKRAVGCHMRDMGMKSSSYRGTRLVWLSSGSCWNSMVGYNSFLGPSGQISPLYTTVHARVSRGKPLADDSRITRSLQRHFLAMYRNILICDMRPSTVGDRTPWRYPLHRGAHHNP